MKEIRSRSNPQIKLATKLRRRRHRQATGLCLLEGARLIQDALLAGGAFHAGFIAPEAAGAHPELLAQLEQAGPVFLTPAPLLRELTDTVTPSGLIAVVHQPTLPPPEEPHFSLVLDRIQEPGNAGTLLRTAAAAGVDLVLFGPGAVDPFNSKVLRAGMGAHFRLPIRSVDAWSEIRALLSPNQQVWVADVQGPHRYDEIDWRTPSALVIGNEAHGPSPEARQLGAGVSIPMAAATESLNAAAAGAVILFEAARQRRSDGRPPLL